MVLPQVISCGPLNPQYQSSVVRPGVKYHRNTSCFKFFIFLFFLSGLERLVGLLTGWTIRECIRRGRNSSCRLCFVLFLKAGMKMIAVISKENCQVILCLVMT